MSLTSPQFPWGFAALLYLISYGGSFFHIDAIYWDDWTLFNVAPDVILETFREAGAVFGWTGHLHVLLLKLGPGIYRVLTFILMFLSGYLLWKIIESLEVITSIERNLITLFFLVFPLNAARIALINFPYTLCYFLFFLAWYLLVCRAGKISRLLSLLLFLFSFNTNSLLVFYALPVAHSIYLFAGFDLKKIIRWTVEYFLFLISPFVWFYVKIKFFAPYGPYVAYNSLNLDKLLLASMTGVPLLLIFVLWLAKKQREVSAPVDRGGVLLYWGAVLVWIGIFPYLAVGAWPTYNDWNSRHQLLMPLGIAVSIVGVTRWVSYGNVLRLSLSALAVCTLINLRSAFEFHVDWLKQREVMRLISKSSEIIGAKTVLFNDKTDRFNAHDRTYRFYEYNGWFKLAYGDQTRWGMNEGSWAGALTEKLPAIYEMCVSGSYNAKDYIIGAPDIVVTIKSSKGPLKAGLTGSGGFIIDVKKIK